MSRVIRGSHKISYPYAKHSGWSKGVDVINRTSHVDNIVAHSDGKVIKVVDYLSGTNHKLDREGRGYGNYVLVLHDDNYVTGYAHMKSVDVSEGDIVRKGDIIGYMGDTGYANGAHLHFEVRKYDSAPVYELINDISKFVWLDSTPYLDSDLPISKAWAENYEPYYYRVRKAWDDAKSQIGAFHLLSKALAFAKSNPGYQVYDENGNEYQEEPEVTTYPDYKLNNSDYYRVRKSWSDYKSQIGAYKSYKGAVNKANENPGYYVFDKNGKQIHGTDPVYEDYEVGSLDYYRVRKSWNDNKSQIGAYWSYKKAIQKAEETPGYHVYDKDGNEIH